jgi:hypothetical protein
MEIDHDTVLPHPSHSFSVLPSGMRSRVLEIGSYGTLFIYQTIGLTVQNQ